MAAAMHGPNDAPRIAAIPGGQVAYLEAGKGTPIVFLHGIGSAAPSWRHQLAAFADRFRVIAWYAPGYGRSSPPAVESPDAGDYARALDAFMRTLAIDRFHLVGHSLGTIMAARFAADHGKDRLLSLTLCCASGGMGRASPEQRKAMLSDRMNDLNGLGPRGMAEKRGPRLLGPSAAPATVREVVEIQAASVTPSGYALAVRMLAEADMFADIARFPPELPVQIVYGEDDAITPPTVNLEIAAACRAPAHPVAKAGHALYLEQPARLNALLAAFVAQG